MKHIFIVASLLFSLSCYAQLPYNPDANNDLLINTGDLTEFLTLFGQSFLAEGLVEVENGGTSAATIEEARLNFDISLFSDSSMNIDGSDVPFGWIEGGLRATGNVATGFQTLAEGSYSTAEGYSTSASGNFSHSQNRFTQATGICSHAEGEGGTASGTAAHVEGFGCNSANIGSHAEGYQSNAIGYASHAEGYQNNSQGLYSHAEGRNNSASGTSSHAEGQNTFATGLTSHAEGNYTVASATRSHAAGYYCVADQPEQTSIGRFNETDQTGALFSIGNGASQVARADAFRVMEDGSTIVNGAMTVSGAITSNGENLNDVISALQAENQQMAQQIADLQLLVDGLINGLTTSPQE